MSYDMCKECGGDPCGMTSLPKCECGKKRIIAERQQRREKAKRERHGS